MIISAAIVGRERTIARLEKVEPSVRSALRDTVAKLTLKLVRHVKNDKLSGQVLQVRTGRLRRSITPRIEQNGAQITGIVGTNVEYAAAHEYGFKGTVSVRAHLRRTKHGSAVVRSHDMKMNLPQRSFLRSALADMRDEITRELAGASVKAARSA